MSFGLLKHFKDQKKGLHTASETSFVEHVLLGHDLGAVLELMELRKSYPHESIKLISERNVTRQTIIDNFDHTVTQIRSTEVVGEIYKSYFEAKILPQKEEAQFYKDGKFHDFSGRAKPMALRRGEEYFASKGFRLDVASLFSSEDWENLDQILKNHVQIRILEGIEKTLATDLVEKNEWLLTFKDYQQIRCEQLYCSFSPKKFVQLLKHKEKLTPQLIDFCTSVHIQSAISTTWEMNKEIYTSDRTLFIPQSMTHEWGHFIVEFEPYDYQNKSQKCHTLFIIHEEEPQSEDMATKIKLMKRVLDRVFPDFEKHITKEYIRYDEDMFMSGIKDDLIEQIGFDYPTLKFLGQLSPLSSQHVHEKFLARVLLS